MRVLLISIKGGSGSDVYYKLLKQGLDKYTDIKSDLIFIPHTFEKVFFLIPLYLKYKKIDFNKYDIIHTNAEFGWWFKRKNKKLVVVVHHNPFDKEFQKYTNLAQKIFYYFWVKPNFKKSLLTADKIITVSGYTKSSIVDYFKLKKNIEAVYAVYNGINTDFFRPIDCESNKNTKTRILFVGNLTKRKGVDLLPKIMEELGDDYELYFTSGRRTRIPKELKLKNMISLGRLNNKQLLEKYNKCDMILLPSRLEGFGYSMVEAMACGKPVIVTNCSALSEIVKNKENGYLCEINNVDDFVEKIRKIKEGLDDDKNFLSNYDYVKSNFSLEIMAKKYNIFYKTIV
jgi:glycosyltransferase involved in cell wall biosynthesis